MEIKSQANAKSRFSIRTSDRRVFRRCLRKWDYQSSLRQNLTHAGTEQNINFWFGSAIHFCMEDYHGYNRFGDPRRALYAYYHAFPEDEMPAGADMHYSLGISMLTYYMQWMQRHNQQTGFETAWMDPNTYEPKEPGAEGAVPAVEIQFYFPLSVYAILNTVTDKIEDAFYYNDKGEWAAGATSFKTRSEMHWLVPDDWTPESDPDKVYTYEDVTEDSVRHLIARDFRWKIIPISYHGTIDRIVRDRYGRYWLWDYKTAKSADTAKLATDDQVSAYLYAARKLFPFPVYGFVYLQMTKDKVQQPKRLRDGTLSVDKRQKTTYGLVRQAILEDYGSVAAAPAKIVDFLNHMAALEEPEGDRFVRWDFVKRNDHQLDMTEAAIYGELSLMLNPRMYCFPSPTRDCSWDCPMRDACILSDMGDQSALEEFLAGFSKRPHTDDGNEDEWRGRIAWPGVGSEANPEELVSLDEVLGYDASMEPMYEAQEDGTFKFLYEQEEDC